MSPYRRPLVALAIHTGMRRGQLLGLRWGDVDLPRRTLTLHQTKDNERHAMPVNEMVASVLKALPRHLDNGRLCPGINGNMVVMAFRRVGQRAGIRDCHCHDLCHTFGSHLAMTGFNLRTIHSSEARKICA